MTTPPSGPYDGPNRPQDVSQFPPGQPNQYGGQQYGGQPAQPGQYGVPAPNYGGQFQPPSYDPYNQGGGPSGYGYAPPGQLAGWPIRVGASILDSLIMSVPWIIGLIVSLVISGDSETMTPGGGVALGGGFFVTFLVWVWNRVIQQGRTGQSFGKKLTGLKIVHQQTGQLIGTGATLGREVLAQIFNQLCFLNLLWPLWDEKQQTWHDKIVNDIVIRT